MSWLLWAGWSCVALACLGVLSQRVALPAQSWIVLATGGRYLNSLALLGWVCFAVAGHILGLVIASALYLASVSVQLRVRHWRRTAAANGGAAVDGALGLTVLTANLLIGRADATGVLEVLKRERVDVFLAQELTADSVENLQAAGITAVLPYSFTKPHGGGEGTGIWSRYPLTETISHPGFGFEVLSARLQFPDEAGPTVWSVHLEPPWPRPPGSWLAEFPLLGRQIAATAGANGPAAAVIVGGDFNATWDHRQFRLLLRNGFIDAAAALGRGYLRTWPSDKPIPALIGLDHVLLRSAQPRAVSRISLAGSDHCAVLVEVVLPAR